MRCSQQPASELLALGDEIQARGEITGDLGVAASAPGPAVACVSDQMLSKGGREPTRRKVGEQLRTLLNQPGDQTPPLITILEVARMATGTHAEITGSGLATTHGATPPAAGERRPATAVSAGRDADEGEMVGGAAAAHTGK